MSDLCESQTRSPDYLKKPSMNQHAQQISATLPQRAQRTTQQISATSELDLPQSGSEDEDEMWLTELNGSEAGSTTKAAAEAYTQLEEYLKAIDTFYQHLKTHNQSVAEPNLPRT